MMKPASRKSYSRPLITRIVLMLVLSLFIPPLVQISFFFAAHRQEIALYDETWLVSQVANYLKNVGAGDVVLRELDGNQTTDGNLKATVVMKADVQARLGTPSDSQHAGAELQSLLKSEIGDTFGEIQVVMRQLPSNLVNPFAYLDFVVIPPPVDGQQNGLPGATIPGSFTIVVNLDEAHALVVEPQRNRRSWSWIFRLIGMLAITLTCLATIAFWTARSLVKPLNALGSAVENFGTDYVAAPVPKLGISEYDAIAEKFNALQDQIAAYLRERNKIIGAISHDLRTPLTRLRLYAEYLHEDELKKNAISSIDDMQSMIDETLTHAQSLWNQGSPAHLDVGAILLMETNARAETGERVTYSGPEKVPYLGHAVGLRRAFTNLIDNGIKYGGSVGITLTSSTREILVTISDAGKGFDPADEDKAVAPFERLEGSRSRQTGGTGLGLSIAKDAIERHGGSLTFQRVHHRGFDVRVRLPRT